MSKEDIDKAVKEAEKFAAEDKKRREEVDEKNNAENLCYAVEKFVSDNGDKLDAAEKSDLSAKAAALKESIGKSDMAAVKSQSEELQKAMYAASEKLYKNAAPQQGQQPQGGADAGQAGPSGNVYDAEYKDVDGENK